MYNALHSLFFSLPNMNTQCLLNFQLITSGHFPMSFGNQSMRTKFIFYGNHDVSLVVQRVEIPKKIYQVKQMRTDRMFIKFVQAI